MGNYFFYGAAWETENIVEGRVTGATPTNTTPRMKILPISSSKQILHQSARGARTFEKDTIRGGAKLIGLGHLNGKIKHYIPFVPKRKQETVLTRKLLFWIKPLISEKLKILCFPIAITCAEKPINSYIISEVRLKEEIIHLCWRIYSRGNAVYFI